MRYILILLLTLCTSGCVEIGIGGAFLPRIPKQQLTGHEQFHISAGFRQDITDHIILETKWHHFSNGAQLGIGNYPNYGLDTIGSQLIWRY